MAQITLYWYFIAVSIFCTDVTSSSSNIILSDPNPCYISQKSSKEFSNDQSSTNKPIISKFMVETATATTAVTTPKEPPKLYENGNSLSSVLGEETDDQDLELVFSPQVPKLNISNSLCSFFKFESDELLYQYNVNRLKRYFYSVARDNDSLNADDIPSAGVTGIDENENKANFPETLPIGCSYLDDDGQFIVIICTGQEIEMVPIFDNFTHADALVFNKTSIQSLDLNSIRGLPCVKHLVFMNGILMRADFNSLLSLHPYIKSLSFVSNSILSFSFSSFFVEPKHQMLRVLVLSHNLITNLPQPAVTNETVLPNLEVLILNDNPLGVLPGDIFYPLRNSSVKILNLKNSQISDISTPSFEDKISPLEFLPHLEWLDLSHNPLLNEGQLAKLLAPFHDFNLKHLLLDDNGYLEVPTGALKKVKSSLISLSLVRATINFLNKLSFPSMPKLISLNLQHSRISHISEGSLDSLKSLRCLRLDGNDLITLPPTYMLQDLQVLTLNENPISKVSLKSARQSSWNNSSRLKLLSMDKVPLNLIEASYFKGLSQLMHLSLNWCSITHIQDRSFKDLINLNSLNLANNQLKNISGDTFTGLVKMHSLDLSGNKLNFRAVVANGRKEYKAMIYEIFNSFSPLPRPKNLKEKTKSKRGTKYIEPDSLHDLFNMESLNLKDNDITFLSQKIFQSFPKLKILDLSQNKIKRWASRVFMNNPHLIYLNLRKNAIDIITHAMIRDFNKPNIKVDLSENPLVCTCSLHSLVNMLNQTIFVNKENYNCRNYGMTVSIWSYISTSEPCEDKIRMDEYTYSESVDYTACVVLSFVSIVSLSSALVTYRNRWFLKYLIYKFKVHYRGPPSDSDDYEYDVFICYSQADRKWVFETLVSEMESSGKMRVCVHERDFLVGEQITSNILRSIKISRKVVVVLSHAFIQSSWCMLELQIASNRTLDERKNKLILLILEPVPLKEQPRQIKLLMGDRTYVIWAPDIEGQKLFWSRLRKAINKPLYNEIHSRNSLIQKQQASQA